MTEKKARKKCSKDAETLAKERNIKALKIIDERIKELESIKGFYWQDEMWRKNVHAEYKELRAVLMGEGKR